MSSVPEHNQPLALEARHFTKIFGGEIALRDVSISVHQGEIVALLGENGSGKSTFVKILAGYHQPEPGAELYIGGTPIELSVTRGKLHDVGLSFVFQDLGIARRLSVAENLFVAHRRTHGIQSVRRIRWGDEKRQISTVLASYGIENIDPSEPVDNLGETAQALLAIVRAAEEIRLFRDRHGEGGVLVLDEPTVFLPEHEKIFLFDLARRIAAHGTAILFVSHDLSAVREIASRAIVLRDGSLAAEMQVQHASDGEIVSAISGQRRNSVKKATGFHNDVGRTMQRVKIRHGEGQQKDQGHIALQVKIVAGGRIEHIELTLYAGAVLGVAGLLGSGCEDLPYAIFGALDGVRGWITTPGFVANLDQFSPRDAVYKGISLVPADRQSRGSAPGLSIENNMLGLVLDDYKRKGLLDRKLMRASALDRCNRYGIRPARPELELSALSGGNQQRVVLTKWLERGPRVLLLHEPTQGVDILTRAQIYDLMRELVSSGVAILWVTTDFEEMATVADRVVVCSDGVITGDVDGPPFDRAAIAAAVYAKSGSHARVSP